MIICSFKNYILKYKFNSNHVVYNKRSHIQSWNLDSHFFGYVCITKFWFKINTSFVKGSLAWLSILPLDVVKSRMQANRLEKQTFLQCFKSVYQEDGLRGYFKGGVPLLVRGFLVSSVTFCVHFQTLKVLSQKNYFVF